MLGMGLISSLSVVRILESDTWYLVRGIGENLGIFRRRSGWTHRLIFLDILLIRGGMWFALVCEPVIWVPEVWTLGVPGRQKGTCSL